MEHLLGVDFLIHYDIIVSEFTNRTLLNLWFEKSMKKEV